MLHARFFEAMKRDQSHLTLFSQRFRIIVLSPVFFYQYWKIDD